MKCKNEELELYVPDIPMVISEDDPTPVVLTKESLDELKKEIIQERDNVILEGLFKISAEQIDLTTLKEGVYYEFLVRNNGKTEEYTDCFLGTEEYNGETVYRLGDYCYTKNGLWVDDMLAGVQIYYITEDKEEK